MPESSFVISALLKGATGIRHRFISDKSDDPDISLVRPTGWNDTHELLSVPAADVDITDTGGYYTSTTVEGALQEIGAGGIGGGGGSPARYSVQEKVSGHGNTNAHSLTLDSTPTNSNIIVVISSMEGAVNINSITQTNVTWTKLAESTASASPHVEIWKGVVAASAGTGITVNLSGSSWGSFAASEWTGLAGTLDQSASTSNSTVKKVALISGTDPDALIVAGAATTPNNASWTAITSPHLMNFFGNTWHGSAWGFVGGGGVVGYWNHGNTNISTCTVSII